MTKKEREEDKRTRIMQAAAKVLAEQGYHRTKIRDIAQEAGVADGTIYLYFDNKEHLLIQLFEQVMERVLSMFRNSVVAEVDAAGKLHQFIVRHLTLIQEDVNLARIITVVLRQSSSFLQDYKNDLFAEYLGLLYSILKEGKETGVFRPDLDVQVMTRATFGALDELALAWLLSSRKETSLEESAQTLSDVLLAGLKPEAQS
jgi:TetR/AcrR family fatty acid metabolism transcriptional regulator